MSPITLIKNQLVSVPYEVYADYPAINNSAIKQILRTPAHYRNYMEAERKETHALSIGHALHCALFEPDRFVLEYAVVPECDRRTKEGKAIYAAFLEEHGDKTALFKGDYELVDAMAKSARSHSTISKLLEEGAAEQSLLTDIDGLPAKVRYDWYRSPSIILDVKTTEDASPDGFARSIAKYGYDIQDAFYTDCGQQAGLDIRAFLFLALEKSPPYLSAIYELDEESRNIGRIKYQAGIRKYKECIDTGDWHGYPTNIMPISLPQWEIRKFGDIE